MVAGTASAINCNAAGTQAPCKRLLIIKEREGTSLATDPAAHARDAALLQLK